MQDDGAEQDCVTADREQVGEIEREPVRRTDEDEWVRNSLRPREQRHEIAERAAARNAGTERSDVGWQSRHEHDQCGDQCTHQQSHVRCARVMELGTRVRLVQ